MSTRKILTVMIGSAISLLVCFVSLILAVNMAIHSDITGGTVFVVVGLITGIIGVAGMNWVISRL